MPGEKFHRITRLTSYESIYESLFLHLSYLFVHIIVHFRQRGRDQCHVHLAYRVW
jgi:hypothetical protein